MRAADRRRARRAGHRGPGALAPATAPVCRRPGRAGAGRPGWPGRGGRPAARVDPGPGARIRPPSGGRPRRRHRDPRGRAGRRAAADRAERHVGAVRSAVGRRDRVRRADPGPAAPGRPVHDGRAGAGPGARRADGLGHPGRPDLPAALGHRRRAAVQPAAAADARDPRREARGDLPGRYREPGCGRRLLRRLPDPRRLGPGRGGRVRKGRGGRRGDLGGPARDPRAGAQVRRSGPGAGRHQRDRPSRRAGP